MSIATANFGRRALPWCGLFCLLLVFTHIVQESASSLPAAVTPPLVVSTNSGMPADDLASSARSRSVLVMISVQDATSGNETEMLCRTTEDRTSSDALLMNAATATDVLPALCDSSWLSTPILYNR